jgi:hypothetical protein
MHILCEFINSNLLLKSNNWPNSRRTLLSSCCCALQIIIIDRWYHLSS